MYFMYDVVPLIVAFSYFKIIPAGGGCSAPADHLACYLFPALGLHPRISRLTP